MEKFNSRGQSLIGVIVILIIGGLLNAGLYYYFEKQIQVIEMSEIIINPEGIVHEKKSTSPQVIISSDILEQGDTLSIRIKSPSPLDEIEGNLGEGLTKINFFKLGEDWMGILGISVKQKPGEYTLTIDSPDGEIFKKDLDIVEREFPVEEFLVSEELKKEGYTQSKIAEELIEKEKPLLDKVFKIFTPEVYFDKPFSYPLKEIEVTGEFGNIRKEGETAIQHLGVDLKAEVGTPVYAVNDGMILFSQETKMYGKTIIIDHGFGIFSFYSHLNELKFSTEEKVKQGDIIGFSGKTGYVLAPHLHFSIKINGSSVDPLRFIEITEKEMLK
jgi:hypothetical protein